MKAVIMAGGKGTRVQSIASNIPKPMLPIDGKPVLEYEIGFLKQQGFDEIIITVGHLASNIVDYFSDGSKFGVHISYYVEDKPLGNAGALIEMRNALNDSFILINGDVIFDIDLRRFVDFHVEHGGLISLVTHPNSHPYDSGLIFCDKSHSVTEWLSKDEPRPRFYKNRVNAGIHIINPIVLDSVRVKYESAGKLDLDCDVLKKYAGTGKMFCYDTPEYIKDMGTPDRFATVAQDVKKGIVKARNLQNKQKAIFLDRDGTINVYKGFIRNLEDFELIDGVAETIKEINSSEYLVIVITNQPVIARGEVSFDELETIHNKMETLLGKAGAYLDGIYFCPHHPDSGFLGEIRELKIECSCRKPKAGLFIKAAMDFNIDLNSSWMVGDSNIDVLAGKAAGCNTALISDDHVDIGQDMTVSCLASFWSNLKTKLLDTE